MCIRNFLHRFSLKRNLFHFHYYIILFFVLLHYDITCIIKSYYFLYYYIMLLFPVLHYVIISIITLYYYFQYYIMLLFVLLNYIIFVSLHYLQKVYCTFYCYYHRHSVGFFPLVLCVLQKHKRASEGDSNQTKLLPKITF